MSLAPPTFAQWSPFTTYVAGDVVFYAGFNYACANTNVNVAPFPVNADWTLLNPGGGGGGLTNPLTSDLLCGGFDIQNVGTNNSTTFNGVNVGTEFLSLPPPSLASRISVANALEINPVDSSATRFLVVPPECSVLPTGPDELTNKAYVDSVAGGAGFIPGPEQTYSAIGTTTIITTINSNTSFTFNGTGADAFGTNPLALNELQSIYLTFKPPVVAGPDYLNCSFFIPNQYGFLIYPNSLVPVWNGIAEFGDQYAFVAGDNAGLRLTATEAIFCLNGTPVHTYPITSPTPTATFSFVATNATLAPYTITDLQQYSVISGAKESVVSIEGIFNKLRIVPTATGLNSQTQTYTSVPTPSSWVPDATPNTTIVPTNTGAGTPWRLTKAAGAGGAATRWWVWPYNPQYSLSPPFSAPSVVFNKNALNAVWAVIRIKTANITTQGAFFFNIYTYDYGTAPAQDFSTRFDYSANNVALPLTTGTLALQTEFRYLVYALDAPKIVASPPVGTTITQANGQTPGQTTSQMLRDPYDIYTDIPHIGFSAVAFTNGATVPSEINNVPVKAITFGCTSSAITGGVDMEVEAIGYRASNGTVNEKYLLTYS